MFNYLKSSILSKVVMAVTGFMLVGYVVIHTCGNMLIFLGQDSINSWAEFLHSLGPVLWILRAVLLAALVLHIITSIRLKVHNNSSTPVKYAVKRYVKAKLTSRTMIWTGLMILAFVVYHIMHFTLHITNPQDVFPQNYTPDNAVSDVLMARTDVFTMVVLGFQNIGISIAYIIAVILVGFHLNHAIQSMFQTLGWNHPRYFDRVVSGSVTLSVLVVLCLISIPISIMLNLVGGSV